MGKDIKNISVELNMETWKKLKIISISKDMKLQEVIKDILERGVSRKKDITEEMEV